MTMRLTVAALLLCSGCASMINGRWETVPVDSFPSGAKVSVACGAAPADGGLTPTRIQVERRARDCRVTLTKDGYEPQEVTFERQMSRATDANKVVAAPVGIFAALGLAILIPEEIMSIDEALGGGFTGGVTLGAAPANQIDKHTGGAYKQVPGELYVILVRSPKE